MVKSANPKAGAHLGLPLLPVSVCRLTRQDFVLLAANI